jgi:hypothetical protein
MPHARMENAVAGRRNPSASPGARTTEFTINPPGLRPWHNLINEYECDNRTLPQRSEHHLRSRVRHPTLHADCYALPSTAPMLNPVVVKPHYLMKKPFGLSVLTNRQAARILPSVLANDHLRAVEAAMQQKHVEPTVMQNVLAWQAQKRRVK